MGALQQLGTALRRPSTYTGQAREALSMARVIAKYPFGVLDSMVTTGRPAGDLAHDTPVILVHGFAHNRSGWFVLQEHLRRARFTSVHAMNYNPWRHDVPELAAQLAEKVAIVKALTGAEKVHVIGHSLGGLILRWYVQELHGDLDVHTGVTIASPHEGSLTALPVPSFMGRTANELKPGSWVIRRLERGARKTDVRWIAYYSNLDLLVPGASAMIRPPVMEATNIFVKDLGHMALMISPTVAASIVTQLEAAEGYAARIEPLVQPGEETGTVLVPRAAEA